MSSYQFDLWSNMVSVHDLWQFESPVLNHSFIVNAAWKPLSQLFNLVTLDSLILAKIFRIFLHVVARWWRARVSAICGCCDSRAAVFTNTWQRFVGKNNWACRGVDTYSCLQGWHKDLTLMAVQHRHQLGLEPEKMSFTSLHQHRHSLSFTTMTLTPSADDFSLFPLLYFLVPSTFPSPSFQSLFCFNLCQFLSQSLFPNLFCLLPLAKPFQWHTTEFLPTFLPPSSISLCGTVALDFCDDFICLS